MDGLSFGQAGNLYGALATPVQPGIDLAQIRDKAVILTSLPPSANIAMSIMPAQRNSRPWQAIVRLNRVQSEAACKEALIELRDVINAGMARARKAAGLGMEFPTPNSKHISHLLRNPNSAGEFDIKFSPGSSLSYLEE